jgi:hypothetical protein
LGHYLNDNNIRINVIPILLYKIVDGRLAHWLNKLTNSIISDHIKLFPLLYHFETRIFFKYTQSEPLNGITLGQRQTYSINGLIIISESASKKNKLYKSDLGLVNQDNLIPLSDDPIIRDPIKRSTLYLLFHHFKHQLCNLILSYLFTNKVFNINYFSF